LHGKKIWNKEVNIINVKGQQSGQKLISDRSGGVISAWLDKRKSSPKGNYFAQRINPNGKKLWDSTGVEISSDKDAEKSYLNLLPNKLNGAAALFKMKRKNETNIYGQRVLGNGKFIFEILSVNTFHENDKIKITWQTESENNNKGFYVERAISDTNWTRLKFIEAQNKKGTNYYEFFDKPEQNGNLLYRIAQVDNENNIQRSKVSKIDYFGAGSSNFILAQNIPNPFNENTTIKYYLPEKCKVELEIFNSQIESLGKIVDEVQNAGEHSAIFDTSVFQNKLQSGIYFYKLKAGNFVEVRKMILMN